MWRAQLDELILIAANAHRDEPRLARFVNAVERATTYIVNHPDEAWERFRASDPDTLDNELNRRAWRDTLPRLALRPGALDERRYEAFARFMQAHGLVDEVPVVADYAVALH